MGRKGGPRKGTGGHGRRKLEGRGPTPKAEDRPGHPAQRRAKAAARRAAAARPSRPTRSGQPGEAEVVTGRNAVVEALRAGVPATALLLAVGLEPDDRVTEMTALADARGVEIREVPRTQLDRLVGSAGASAAAAHQGVALRVPPFDYYELEDLRARLAEAGPQALVVALDAVTDPHNLGAVARSAAAFGAHGLLLGQRRTAGVTPAAWKVSAGALARLPVARVPNLVRALAELATDGLMLAGLDADGELDLDRLDLALGPLVLVVGAEGRGLSRLVRERCDVLVRIPLAGGVESLNASVAAGVALAEVARRRRTDL